jgi:integrase
VQSTTIETEDCVKALTEDELRTLLAEIPDEWLTFVELLAHTGMRIGEAIALTWGDVDLGRRRLTVTKRLYRGTLDAPKSKHGRRTIPLADGLARSLWRSRGTAADSQLIFTTGAGTAIDPKNLASRVLKPAAKRAGVSWAGFHTFRHTCATMLFRHGANAKQAQMWLGHHSPAFTLATYVHLLPDDLPDADFLDTITRPSTMGQEVSKRPETLAL